MQIHCIFNITLQKYLIILKSDKLNKYRILSKEYLLQGSIFYKNLKCNLQISIVFIYKRLTIL